MIPVIVYLHAHDSARYLQPYGYPVATPHLQAFADDAVMFRNAFAAAPGCSPSRSALLTGALPHVNGVIGLAHRGFQLVEKDWHLAAQLKERGYRTVISGMQHVWEGDQADVGYTDDIRPSNLNAEFVLPNALSMLEQCVADGTPLFLDIGFEEAHRPYHPAPAADFDHVRPPFQFPDVPEVRQDIADLHNSLKVFDESAGQVFDAMKRLGVYDDAFIVVTTDHGLPFPGMKCSLSVYGTGVFLLMRGPNGSELRNGKSVDALVTHMDVLPTLFEHAGWDAPQWFHGKSLTPALTGDARLHDAVFGEITFHATWEPTRSIRTPEWLLIQHFGEPHAISLANVDEGPTRDVLVGQGWPYGEILPEFEIFDQRRDPAEQHNVAEAAYAQGAKAELIQKLHEWMEATNDPFVTGDWHIPDVARMNRIGAISANDELIHPTEELDFTSHPVRRK